MSDIRVMEKPDVLNGNTRGFAERREELKKIDEAQRKAEEREKNSPFSRWSQFNLEHTKEMMWLALKYPKAHAILYFLVDQMDEHNAVMCSYQVLQEVLEISRQTISKNIKILQEYGFIAILKSGTSNVYTINDSVYWKSWGNKKRYSKFPANVVLALSEQDEAYQMSFDDIKYDKLKTINKKS